MLFCQSIRAGITRDLYLHQHAYGISSAYESDHFLSRALGHRSAHFELRDRTGISKYQH